MREGEAKFEFKKKNFMRYLSYKFIFKKIINIKQGEIFPYNNILSRDFFVGF